MIVTAAQWARIRHPITVEDHVLAASYRWAVVQGLMALHTWQRVNAASLEALADADH